MVRAMCPMTSFGPMENEMLFALYCQLFSEGKLVPTLDLDEAMRMTLDYCLEQSRANNGHGMLAVLEHKEAPNMAGIVIIRKW